MLKYITEFIGTFIFLSVILNAVKNPEVAALMIGLGLTAVIVFGSSISGGHYNPVVSVLMYLNGKLSSSDLIPYISSQLLAAVAAKYFYDVVNKRIL